MSNLNKKNTAVSAGLKKAGHEGNVQWVKTSEYQLFEIIVMSLYGKSDYYQSTNQVVKRLDDAVRVLVKEKKLDFVANAILYARTVANIRTMPIVLTVLFAKALHDHNVAYPKMRNVVTDVIQRADEITDLAAYALEVFGKGIDVNQRKKHIPNAIKVGLRDTFGKFNEYQFAKYNRAGAVKLRDVVRMVHPNAGKYPVVDKIFKETLEIPKTWETTLSINGQKSGDEKKSDKEMWEDLIDTGALGYMALLRNLRNISQAGVSVNHIKKVADRISNPEEVAKSKQLPFRFVNALENMDVNTPQRIKDAIVDALDISAQNVPYFGDNVWIIVDTSGSMRGKPINIASIFAAMLVKANRKAVNLKVTQFDTRAKHMVINSRDSVMSIAQGIRREANGGATYLSEAMNLKPTLGFEPDVVIVLSDMQVHDAGAVNQFAKGTVLFAMNLNPYETTPISNVNGWYQLAGFSEKVFDFIAAQKQGKSIVDVLSKEYVGTKVKYLFKNLAVNDVQTEDEDETESA